MKLRRHSSRFSLRPAKCSAAATTPTEQRPLLNSIPISRNCFWPWDNNPAGRWAEPPPSAEALAAWRRHCGQLLEQPSAFSNANVDMVFIHSARSPKDIIYHRELEHMASRIDNFSLHLICEKHGLGEPWAGYRGYLNHKMLELMAPDFMEREVFCCGPTPYMNAVKRLLESNGFDMSRYHEESFGATPPEARADAVEQAEQAADAPELDAADLNQVEFTASGKSIRVGPAETVHAAAAK